MKPRQPIKRKTPLKRSQKPICRSKVGYSKIKPVADARAENLKIYSVLRRDYLLDNPKCQGGPLCAKTGCDGKSVEIHHSRGREGWLLTEVQYFRAVSRQCHNYCEAHPKEAKEMDLSGSRMILSNNRKIGWFPGKEE